MVWLLLLVFVSAVAIDAAHAYYVQVVSDGKPYHAAFASVAIYAASCVGWLGLLKAGYVVLIPEVLGLWLGTFLVVRRKRN